MQKISEKTITKVIDLLAKKTLPKILKENEIKVQK